MFTKYSSMMFIKYVFIGFLIYFFLYLYVNYFNQTLTIDIVTLISIFLIMISDHFIPTYIIWKE